MPESDEGLVLYQTWQRVFKLRGIHEESLAEDASERLAAENIKFPRDHLPRLVEIAIEILRDRSAQDPANSEAKNLDQLKREGRGCPHCAGEGLVSIAWLNPRDGIARGTCTAYCLCAVGRRIRGMHDEDMHRRIPMFADVQAGRYRQFEVLNVEHEYT